MTVLILLLCTVAALFIHRTFVRPILDWFEQREYAERMRAVIHARLDKLIGERAKTGK